MNPEIPAAPYLLLTGNLRLLYYAPFLNKMQVYAKKIVFVSIPHGHLPAAPPDVPEKTNPAFHKAG